MLKPDETFLRIANPGRFAWNGNFHESSFKNDHVHRLLSSASPRFINTSFSLPLFVYLFKKKKRATSHPPSLLTSSLGLLYRSFVPTLCLGLPPLRLGAFCS